MGREDSLQFRKKEGEHPRPDLMQIARGFIQQKHPGIREVRFTHIKETGPIAGLNVYELKGTTTVLVGDIPTLQGKRFHIIVRITRDGRVVDRHGRVS